MIEKCGTLDEKEARWIMQQRINATKKNTRLELRKLAKTANKQHSLSAKCWQKGLEHACLAGDALSKARNRVGRKDWKPWLKVNFQGSYETATIYIRIARKWTEPEIQEARENGTINSLNSFLAFTRKPGTSDELTEADLLALQPTEKEELQQSIMLQIKGRIKRLDVKLLKAIEDNAQPVWAAAMKEAKLQSAPEWVKDWRERSEFWGDLEEPHDPTDEEIAEEHEREMQVMGPRRCKDHDAA